MLLLPPVGAALELRAAPLSETLPVIGRALGVTMRASPAIGEEIAIARLDGAMLEATKAHLAEAFAGEWRTDADGSLVFSPSRPRRERERREERETRVRIVREVLATYRDRAKALPLLDAATIDALHRRRESFERYEERRAAPAPIDRLLIRLASELPVESVVGWPAFATDPPRVSRVVFSLAPTSMQRLLGPGTSEALRRYREESADWEAQVGSRAFDETSEDQRPGSATRALLIVRTSDRSVDVQIAVFDGTGRLLDGGDDRIEGEKAISQNEEGVPFHIAPYSSPLSSSAATAAALLGEPLAGRTSDALLAAAREAHRSVIIAPGDDLVGWKPPSEGVLGMAPSAEDEPRFRVAFDTPGWLTIERGHPARRRREFFPRSRLRNAVRRLLVGERASLQARLAYTRARPPVSDALAIDDLVEWVNGESYVRDDRLAAFLTPDEWRHSTRNPVPIMNLAPKTREALIDLVYGSEPPQGHASCRRGLEDWNDEVTNVPPEWLVLRLSSEIVPIERLTIEGVIRWLDLSDYQRLHESYATSRTSGFPKIEVDFDASRPYECLRWQCEIVSRPLSWEDAQEPPVWSWASLDDTPTLRATTSCDRRSNDQAL